LRWCWSLIQRCLLCSQAESVVWVFRFSGSVLACPQCLLRFFSVYSCSPTRFFSSFTALSSLVSGHLAILWTSVIFCFLSNSHLQPTNLFSPKSYAKNLFWSQTIPVSMSRVLLASLSIGSLRQVSSLSESDVICSVIFSFTLIVLVPSALGSDVSSVPGVHWASLAL